MVMVYSFCRGSSGDAVGADRIKRPPAVPTSLRFPTRSAPVPSKSHNHLHRGVAVGKYFLHYLLLKWWKPGWTLLGCFLNKHEKGHPVARPGERDGQDGHPEEENQQSSLGGSCPDLCVHAHLCPSSLLLLHLSPRRSQLLPTLHLQPSNSHCKGGKINFKKRVQGGREK